MRRIKHKANICTLTKKDAGMNIASRKQGHELLDYFYQYSFFQLFSCAKDPIFMLKYLDIMINKKSIHLVEDSLNRK